MTIISLKDYANQHNISYEAVRQQVTRYKEDLGSHVIKDGRQQFLDETAVSFLDDKRQKNPVAVLHQSSNEQIEALKDQVQQLLIKIASQADRISELAQWKADNAVLIASVEQNRLALEAAAKEKELLEGFIRDAKVEIATLDKEKREEAARAHRAEDELQKIKSAGLWQRLKGWR